MGEGWCWGWEPRATVVGRGGGEGVWSRHPVTSQSKVTPTLDRHECLAVGLRLNRIPCQAKAWSQCAPALAPAYSPQLCLGKNTVSSKGTPEAQPCLSGGICVGGFEVGTSGPCSDGLCRALPKPFLPMGCGPVQGQHGHLQFFRSS